MFTGIITAIGTVASVEQDKDWRVWIGAPWACETIDLGASICCSGVCLTVTQRALPTVSLSRYLKRHFPARLLVTGRSAQLSILNAR